MRAGEEIEVLAGRAVHGGRCLAHHEGATVMLRHAIPGERVRARVTRVRSSVVEADAVEVLEPSPDRVVPPCPHAGPGRCGGCDLQHVASPAQAAWKASVIADALRRQGGLDDDAIDRLAIEVRTMPGDTGGLRWRTSARWHASADGRPGFLPWHGTRAVPVAECPVLVPGLEAAMLAARGPGRARAGTDGRVAAGEGRTRHDVRHRSWRIAPATFWQAHAQAPAALVDEVLAQASPAPGERWWDLYAGAGLFTAFLAEAVGPSGSVAAVESSDAAVRDARRALHDLPWASLEAADVRRWVTGSAGRDRPEGIVLDPPRSGAGEAVMRAIAGSRPRRVVMVSCDPVTFARDVRTAASEGYALVRLVGFDAFPMSHHVETVATLAPVRPVDGIS